MTIYSNILAIYIFYVNNIFDIFISRIPPFLDPALPKRDEPRGGEFLQGAQDLHRRGGPLHQRRVRR